MNSNHAEWPKTIQDLELSFALTHRGDEALLIKDMLDDTPEVNDAERSCIDDLLARLKPQHHWIQSLLVAYDLTTEEGVALMCMAEALMRIPDVTARHALLEDSIKHKDWLAQTAPTWIQRASAWSLWLTGHLLPEPDQGGWLNTVKRLTRPVIRLAVEQLMQQLAKYFVVGECMDDAIQCLKEKKHYRYSFDCLGEAAITFEDALRYKQSYTQAIDVLSQQTNTDDCMNQPGISIKLSALYPRYEVRHQHRAIEHLTQVVKELVLQAKRGNVPVTLDAEEADRLPMMLMIFYNVFNDKDLNGWGGFGLAVQAYQKRSQTVIKQLITVARRQKTRIPIRLVKGAYWDSEIKWAQQRSEGNYPVWTQKAHVDLNYRACSCLMMDALDSVYPQFATHNIIDIAHVIHRLDHRWDAFEFQCLQGMGQMVYDPLMALYPLCRVRNYAPIGAFDELLPYLVRRMLENGANNSFLHQWERGKTGQWQHPVDLVKQSKGHQHARIPKPKDLYGAWLNSQAPDLSLDTVIQDVKTQCQALASTEYIIQPYPGQKTEIMSVLNPATARVIGSIQQTSNELLEGHLKASKRAFASWAETSIESRAKHLERFADALEVSYAAFMDLLIREAGKTWEDAIAEIREAIDFLRYYAHQARTTLCDERLPGPTGETNQLTYHGRGVMVCISPWNFPMAIFLGQIAAAIVSGNTVLAKPAEQTPLIAHQLIMLWQSLGLPKHVIQLVQGGRSIAKFLVSQQDIAGVMFTGSTATAQSIATELVNQPGPIRPLIAETGGMNVMWVDQTALIEQVVIDIMTSGFQSAGQRCSALRVCLVEEGIADRLIQMLKQAMDTWMVGNPAEPTTDIGPIIDLAALDRLSKHSQYLQGKGRLIHQMTLPKLPGYFCAPSLFEIDDLDVLSHEVFGPIVHIKRFQWSDVKQHMASVQSWGYGLTMGIHSRLNHRIEALKRGVGAGNIYINRDMIGATVGVQPFGGLGLSGTGPKAGGPNYLKRLCHEVTITDNIAAQGGNAALIQLLE